MLATLLVALVVCLGSKDSYPPVIVLELSDKLFPALLLSLLSSSVVLQTLHTVIG